MKFVLIGISAQVLFLSHCLAQEVEPVPWLTFEQLEDSLTANPKPVFIAFYADWCTVCKRMERETFPEKGIAKILSSEYYVVRMNVESRDTISFGGEIFVNERHTKVNAVHQIPLLMASRKDTPFSLPAMVILNENFEAKARYFQYLDAAQLETVLVKNY